MPTVTLKRVTVCYPTAKGREDLIQATGRTFSKSLRSLFDTQGAQYIDQMETSPEPPDRTNALDQLSLTIRDGETLCVIGPSGCGKTTLLKVLAGLIRPHAGDVLYGGTPIEAIPLADRGVGMVFQNYALYPHLESRDNIGFYDRIRRQPEKIPERIRHIVEVTGVEIKHLLSRKPPTLSGGEQQRVAIARCLARDPKIFLFDEPLSNLDAKLRIETRVQLKRLLRHYKITAVYVTHDQTEAIALADRIAIMRAGKIEQTGPFQVLYDAPINAFVAQFFGTPPMNLFAGHARENAWQGRTFSVGPIRPGLENGYPLWLGIRPEHVRLSQDGVAAQVDLVEPLFPQRRQLVYMQLAGQRCVARFPLDIEVTVGATIHITFPYEHLYLFDPNTGARIG